MFCENCGAKMEEDVLFCLDCGARLGQASAARVSVDVDYEDILPQQSQEAPKKKAPSLMQSPKKWIPILAAVVILVAIICFSSRTPTINLNDYVTITASGYDTMGTATATFDRASFLEDYKNEITLSKAGSNSTEASWALVIYSTYADYLLSYVSGALDVKTDLSNGDEITYEWNCDDSVLGSMFNYKIKYSDITYTVTELEEIATLDVFDFVSLELSGIAPYGVAGLVTSDEFPSYYFSMDVSSGLSNGDVVTVTLDEAYLDEIQYNYGFRPAATSVRYTVEGAAYYANSLEGIQDSGILESMISQASDAYMAHAASTWNSEKEAVESLNYVGSYLLNEKSGVSRESSNILYLVFEATVSNTAVESFTYYWYCKFDNIVVEEDDSYTVDLMSYSTESSNKVKMDSFYYYGYSDLSALCTACVTSKIEYYTYTTDITG